MKQRLTHSLLAITTSILLASCGGSDSNNKVNGSNTSADGTINGSNSQQVSLGNLDGDVSSLIRTVSNSLDQVNQGCANGARLNNVVQFSIRNQGYGNQARLCGNFTPGAISGKAGLSYVGLSTFSDIMVVSEIVSGNQVVGHNIYLSMCGQNLNNNPSYPLISDQRQMSNFRMPSDCIYLNKDNYCPYGVVTSAQNTYMTAASYNYNINGYQGTLSPFEIGTTFFAPGCNSQY